MATLRFGGPVWGTSNIDEYIAKHKALGYRAAYCPDVSLEDTAGISTARKAFSDAEIVIAEVGAWCNMVDPDPETRKKNLDYVTSRLALAEEIGALCCVNIAGSFNPVQWDGPYEGNLGKDFFDLAVENARTIIDAVKPKRAKFSFEMMPFALPDGPESNMELIKAIDRDGFGVHLDPANIVNSPRRYYDTSALLEECFRVLGPWIVSCHAKDVVIAPSMTIHISETRPGLGNLSYKAFLTELSKMPVAPPLMLEHLQTEDEYDTARRYIMSVADELNLEY